MQLFSVPKRTLQQIYSQDKSSEHPCLLSSSLQTIEESLIDSKYKQAELYNKAATDLLPQDLYQPAHV